MATTEALDTQLLEAEIANASLQYDKSISLSSSSLKLATNLFGKSSINLVPIYLALAQSNLGLHHSKKAEEFLSLANWNIVRDDNNIDIDNNLKDAYLGTLHRLYGELYTVTGSSSTVSSSSTLDNALHHAATGIYHSSRSSGPESLDTSIGYFSMGNTFYAMKDVEDSTSSAAAAISNCLGMFDKVVDIWYKAVSEGEDDNRNNTIIPEVTRLTALEMFKRIIDMRIRALGAHHIATGEARYTFGLLLCHGKKFNNEDALKQVNAALGIYRETLGDGHPSTLDVEGVSQQLQSSM